MKQGPKANAMVTEHFEFLNIILTHLFQRSAVQRYSCAGRIDEYKTFSVYLEEQGVDHMLLPALEFMSIDGNEEPQLGSIKIKLSQLLQQNNIKNYLSRRDISAVMQKAKWIT
jgi:aspartate kinase